MVLRILLVVAVAWLLLRLLRRFAAGYIQRLVSQAQGRPDRWKPQNGMGHQDVKDAEFEEVESEESRTSNKDE